MKNFENAFKFCKLMTHATELSFEKHLGGMDSDALDKLLAFMKHDQTKKDLKLLKVFNFGKDLEQNNV